MVFSFNALEIALLLYFIFFTAGFIALGRAAWVCLCKNSQNNVALQNRQGNSIEAFIWSGQSDHVKYARLLVSMSADQHD